MNTNNLSNTLMLGNGFSRSIYKKVSDWGDLYQGKQSVTQGISNPTFRYEIGLIEEQQADNWYKHKLIEKLVEQTRKDNLNRNIIGLDKFGQLLKDHQVNEIITTNYDKGIETVLCEMNGYTYLWSGDLGKDAGEKIYSIRRNIKMKKNSHEIRLWKMHGDIDNIASISLGFDQYCGSLAKMDSYIKGKYKSSSGLECNKTIYEKCKGYTFDDYSWIELFFKTNVYIAGFGLDFAEIDMWWLLNKRCRIIQQGIPVHNKIVYLYTAYDTGKYTKLKADEAKRREKLFEEKKAVLQAFGVEVREIEIGDNYIQSMFEQIMI